MDIGIELFLLTLLAITGLAVARTRDLFPTIILTGIYSLLSASFFVVLDAVDVSFTEAAVGGGISTILMLSTFSLVGTQSKSTRRSVVLPLLVVLVTGGALVYATLDMPRFADGTAPIHRHLAPYYLENSETEIGPPNVVTSVLAAYRGYDTLGETTVILTAGIAVSMLLGTGVVRFRRAKEVP